MRSTCFGHRSLTNGLIVAMAMLRSALLLASLVGLALAQPSCIRVNCGGDNLNDIGFLKDSTFYTSRTAGPVRKYFNAHKGKPLAGSWRLVYDSHAWTRANTLVYAFKVKQSAKYVVSLMFAENFKGNAKQGARLIDVSVNNVQYATNLDVYARAGKILHKPVFLRRTSIMPQNGFIIVRIGKVKENPFISGIVICGDGAKDAAAPASGPLTPPSSPQTPPEPKPAPPPSGGSSGGSSGGGSSGGGGNPTGTGSGKWRMVQASGTPTRRHEACAVTVNGKVYLIGGRKRKPVNVYDPATGKWTKKGTPNVEVHHMQCVAYKNRYVYIGGSWYGGFPREKTHTVTWRYDTVADKWAKLKGLGSRARGGGAFVLHKGYMYLAFGNRGGHGKHATTLSEFDRYDPNTNTWTKMPSAPQRFARDHVGGAIVGGKLCVSGGRNGGVADFWNAPVKETVCFDFNKNQWEQKANLPSPRAGAATGATCQGMLMVAGGEGKLPSVPNGRAFDRVDLYDIRTNSFKKPSFLVRGRHGTGLGIAPCSCGNIYYPSGSGGLGGSPELTSMEVWSLGNTAKKC